jgi:ATP-dependent Clp protease ATP-binding subunit ClpC
MHQRFTDQARRAVALAQDEAKAAGSDCVGTAHLLLGLVGAGGVAAMALESAGMNAGAIRDLAGQMSGQRERAVQGGNLPLTGRAANVLELSLRAALRLGDNHVGTEHILLALMDEPGAAGGEVLVRLGGDPR